MTRSLVMSVMGGEGEFLLLGLGCLETEYRHLVSNPDRLLSAYLGPGVNLIGWECNCNSLG